MLLIRASIPRTLAVVFPLVLFPALGRAERTPSAEVNACASASEDAQNLRRAQKLRDARDKLLVCSRAVCPAPIKRDCDQMLSQIDVALPTVVLGARDDQGHDLVRVRVTLDGAPLAGALEGHAVAVDPGAHALRFEREDGGTIEQTFVAREGEKGRSIQVVFPTPRGVTASPQHSRGDESARDTPPRPAWTAYALASVGLVALGSFAYLAVSGQSDYDHCVHSGCTTSELGSIDRKRVLSWASLGVGAAAAIGAVIVFASVKGEGPRTATSTTKRQAPLNLSLAVGAGNAFLEGSW
jgi:hypothetical protein